MLYSRIVALREASKLCVQLEKKKVKNVTHQQPQVQVILPMGNKQSVFPVGLQYDEKTWNARNLRKDEGVDFCITGGIPAETLNS